MHGIEIFVIAVGLAMDAFSVSIGAGIIIEKITFGHYFRLAFHFGFFQFIMPVIGYFGGIRVGHIIGDFDHWVAFALLAFIGIKMVYSSIFDGDDELLRKDPSRGWNLVVLSFATSIDALAVGISLGVIGCAILFPSIVIGIVCAAFSIAGIFIGKKVGSIMGRRAELVGGILLIAIGTKILLEHMGIHWI